MLTIKSVMIIVVDVKKLISLILIIQCVSSLYRPVRESCPTETNLHVECFKWKKRRRWWWRWWWRANDGNMDGKNWTVAGGWGAEFDFLFALLWFPVCSDWTILKWLTLWVCDPVFFTEYWEYLSFFLLFQNITWHLNYSRVHKYLDNENLH